MMITFLRLHAEASGSHRVIGAAHSLGSNLLTRRRPSSSSLSTTFLSLSAP